MTGEARVKAAIELSGLVREITISGIKHQKTKIPPKNIIKELLLRNNYGRERPYRPVGSTL